MSARCRASCASGCYASSTGRGQTLAHRGLRSQELSDSLNCANKGLTVELSGFALTRVLHHILRSILTSRRAQIASTVVRASLIPQTAPDCPQTAPRLPPDCPLRTRQLHLHIAPVQFHRQSNAIRGGLPSQRETGATARLPPAAMAGGLLSPTYLSPTYKETT